MEGGAAIIQDGNPRSVDDRPGQRVSLGARSPQIALTHQQIAALAGTSRETTTKVLRDFADQHLIRLARGRITVLAPDRLADHAG